MATVHPRIPPLQSLVFFEAAARHLNFTSAAHELHTTQPAVSHRVRDMEEVLGVPLFMREHRGVRLTDEGQRLYATVRQSLEALRLAMAEVRPAAPQATLTLATDFGFAKLWLMPRMQALHDAVPGLQLRLLTSQAEIDPRRHDVDFTIVFDNPPHTPNDRLFPELVVPVCSRAFKSRHGPFHSAADLAHLPLLHLQQASDPTRWINWTDWFRLQDTSPPSLARGLTINDYSLVVHAAVAGHGVALGWAPLVDELLDRGELVIAFDRPLQTQRGYFLVAGRAQPQGSVHARFRDWLLAQCGHREVLETLSAARVGCASAAA